MQAAVTRQVEEDDAGLRNMIAEDCGKISPVTALSYQASQKDPGAQCIAPLYQRA